MKAALYAFSGDPITYGHVDVIERMSKIFDKIIVAIGSSPDKKYTFSLEERLEMAKKVLSYLENVQVISFDGLLVDYARENNIQVIIRGLRNGQDFNYELNLAQINKSQYPQIETIFIPADQEKSHISSSMVKAIVKEYGPVHFYVPMYVKQKLEEKMNGQYFVGVTGEIGCGKTYVSKKLEDILAEKINVHIVELDIIGHEILENLSEPLYEETRKEILSEFGTLDRKELGEIVFTDYKRLQKLNEIMHEPILVRLRREIYGKKGIIFLNAALLAETNTLYLCNNNVILIYCNKESQIKRLRERGYDEAQIERRIKSQYNFERKKREIKKRIKKDNHGKLWIFDNSDKSKEKIEQIANQILEYFNLK